MTRCNIRNGTQNEIKRHRGPQRARSNPRYGNLKGEKKKCKLSPPHHRNLLNPIIPGSQQPGWAPAGRGMWAPTGWPSHRIPTCHRTCGPPWLWPHNGEQPQCLWSPLEGGHPRARGPRWRGDTPAPVLTPCPLPQAFLTGAIPALGTHRELLASLSTSISSRLNAPPLPIHAVTSPRGQSNRLLAPVLLLPAPAWDGQRAPGHK